MQVAADNHLGLLPVGPPLFHQGNKQGAGLGKNLEVRMLLADGLFIDPASDGGPGADDPDPACFGGGNGLVGRRRYHLDDRHLKFPAQGLGCHTGGGVAGNDDDLRPFLEQEFGVAQGVVGDGRCTF